MQSEDQVDLTRELEWINFCAAKAEGDSRNELIAFFGSRTFEKLEARYRAQFPTPMQAAIDSIVGFNPASVLK